MEKLKALSTGKKLLIGAVAVGVVAAGLLQFQWSTKVNYYEVGTQTIEQLVHVNALILPKESAWYTAQTGGILTQVAVELDGSVKKDDLLVSIQPFDFIKKQTDVKKLVEALTLVTETELDEKGKADYQAALKKFDDQNMALEQAWIAHGSVLDLFKKQMISSDAYKESLIQINDQLVKYINVVTDFKAAVAILRFDSQPYTDAVKALESAWEPAESLKELMRPKEENGKSVDTIVSDQQVDFNAVKDGIIARITAEKRMYVPLGAPLLELANPERARMQMEIPVEQLAQIKVGTEMRTKAADGTLIKGTVSDIDNVITDQMQSDGSIIKLVKTHADLEVYSKYKFYSTATASVIVNYAENAVVVPKDLVNNNKSNYSVWINQNGVLSEKPVVVSFETDEFYVIKSGVKAGDKLVMNTKLHLGQKIK